MALLVWNVSCEFIIVSFFQLLNEYILKDKPLFLIPMIVVIEYETMMRFIHSVRISREGITIVHLRHFLFSLHYGYEVLVLASLYREIYENQ